MSDWFGVLIGMGTTGFGVGLGALLERWRDNTRWKREEQMRWTNDLRVLYRDLLASGDEFFRRLAHTRTLERRAKSERSMSEAESERLVRLLTDSFDVMEREREKMSAIVADIQLIGSKEESETTAVLALQVLAGTVLPYEGDFRRLRAQYDKAKKEVIAVARRSLRRA